MRRLPLLAVILLTTIACAELPAAPSPMPTPAQAQAPNPMQPGDADVVIVDPDGVVRLRLGQTLGLFRGNHRSTATADPDLLPLVMETPAGWVWTAANTGTAVISVVTPTEGQVNVTTITVVISR